MPYEIGYRRPPKSGQFNKGVSGNPKGRPKGSRNFNTLLEQELAQKVVVNENGRRMQVTRLQAMVKRMVGAALQGDQKAVLTLVNILRQSAATESAKPEVLLPDNYEQVLADYVASHGTPLAGKSNNSGKAKGGDV